MALSVGWKKSGLLEEAGSRTELYTAKRGHQRRDRGKPIQHFQGTKTVILVVIDQMNTLEKMSNDGWELEILFDGREKTSALVCARCAPSLNFTGNKTSVLLHLS